MKINVNNWNDMQWKKVVPGLDRKVFSGEGATVALHLIDPHGAGKPEKHVNEQIVYIIKGECDMHIEDKVYNLKEGGIICIPPNVEHYGVSRGTEDIISLEIFTPKRPEYLK